MKIERVRRVGELILTVPEKHEKSGVIANALAFVESGIRYAYNRGYENGYRDGSQSANADAYKWAAEIANHNISSAQRRLDDLREENKYLKENPEMVLCTDCPRWGEKEAE